MAECGAALEGEPSGGATTQPTYYLTLFSCPFCHNLTLQELRLPSVTTTVTKFVFTQSEPNFPRFINRRNKRCMLVSTKPRADFSRGCAVERIGHSLSRPSRWPPGVEANQCSQRPSEPFCRVDSERPDTCPACGSGNFLSVSMQQLLNSEREVITFAAEVGLPSFFPKVGPEQISRGRG